MELCRCARCGRRDDDLLECDFCRERGYCNRGGCDRRELVACTECMSVACGVCSSHGMIVSGVCETCR